MGKNTRTPQLVPRRTVRLTPALLEAVQREAMRTGASQSTVIRTCVATVLLLHATPPGDTPPTS
jgi:hypothetical protein